MKISVSKQDVILQPEISTSIQELSYIRIIDDMIGGKIIVVLKIDKRVKRVPIYEGDDYPVGGVLSLDKSTVESKIKEVLGLS